MKGFISNKIVAVLCCAAASASSGCVLLPDRWYDYCYPQRYEYMARSSVNAAMAPQVQNGHVLDQTVWNYYFEAGTDRLTAGGLERLAYVARRRPCPDPVLFLQTAQDLVYDRNAPEKLAEERQTLDGKRIAAVQAYLTTQTAGRPVPFQIVIHDPAEPALASAAANNMISQFMYRFMGGNYMVGSTGMGMAGMGGMPMGNWGMGGMGMGGGGATGGASGAAMGMGMGSGSTGGGSVTGR